jgi:methyl-accepting chemotaxis protein
MSFINNLKIGAKILVLVVMVATIGLIGAAYSGSRMVVIDSDYSSLLEKDVAAQIAAAKADRSVAMAGYHAFQTIAAPPLSVEAQKGRQEYQEYKQRAVTRLDEAMAAAPAYANDLRGFQTSASRLFVTMDAAVGQSDRAEATRQMAALRDPVTSLSNAMRDWNDAQTDRIRDRSTALTDQTRSTAITTVAALVFAILAGGASAMLVSRFGITAPLNELASVMRTLASGDLSVSVNGQSRRDEVGQMAKSVQAFKEEGQRAVALDREAATQRAAAAQERAEAENLRSANAQEQALVVTALGEGLSRLSAGDLMYQIRTNFPPAYEKLKADFNGAMTQLEDAISIVVRNVSGIRSGAGEISQAADDLSRRTEQQAASLEETAAALDQITATVNKTASGARQASDVVQAARGDAEKSGVVVRDAVSAMTAIEQSSSQINQIIGVIDEIAFQTNLLALNAGVEAARAGDAGRGFAVVASEVRALAQRSAEAAKEIKTLISASTGQVGAGVKLVGETGEALQRIVDRVAEIDSLVTEIAASAQEQAVGLAQVNTAVNQMDQVTQQNAAMVEQSTAASHSLAQEAEVLRASVSQFQTAEGGRQPAAATQPNAKPTSAKSVVNLRTTGRGGAALKVNAAPQLVDDSWEAF